MSEADMEEATPMLKVSYSDAPEDLRWTASSGGSSVRGHQCPQEPRG
jgi:hypothetical protein